MLMLLELVPRIYLFTWCIIIYKMNACKTIEVLLICVVLICLGDFSTALIPSYLHVCHRNETDMASCIKNSVNFLRPKLKEGIPELDLPPLEPMDLRDIKLRGGPTSAAINANITNLKVWGPAAFVVTELQPNMQNNTFHFKLMFPHLHFEGNYDLDVRILLINIKGNGPIYGNFTDYRCDIFLQGRIIEREKSTYLKFHKPQLRLDIGKADIKLENLFAKDAVLRQAFDDILNANSDVFINEIKPALEKSFGEFLDNVLGRLTDKFSYDELFP